MENDMERRVMVVFIDALGPAQLARLRERLPWLSHTRSLAGELGYSSGALATLLTGEAPASHGRMCLFSRRANGEPPLLAPLRLLGLLPRLVHERSRVRRLVAKAFARHASLTGYFALHRVPPSMFAFLDVPERDDLFRADTIAGCPTFLSLARQAGVDVMAAPWQLPEAARWEEATREIRARKPRLSLLYASDLDAALHREGSGSRAAEAVLDATARRVEQAREALDGAADVTTIVVGDHGMADVVEVIDPRALCARLGDARVFVDSTMLRIWGDARALDAARFLLTRAALPGRFLDRPALATRGAPTEGDPYGAAIFVLDEGRIFAPSFVGGRVRGMHGYDVASPSASAALASDAPLPEGTRSLRDVAPLVTSALGLS
jgi:Type I phosphodiesterase / nucleotide pyrophosphatase